MAEKPETGLNETIVSRANIAAVLDGARARPTDRHVFTLPPHMGGDVKNIRRRLEAPAPNWVEFVAAEIAVLTTIVTTIKLFTTDPKVALFWLIAPITLSAAAGAVAVLKLLNSFRARKNPDLLQAQADADVLVVWQEEARVKVDRELQAKHLEAERARLSATDDTLSSPKKS